MNRVGIIGYGEIGSWVARRIADSDAPGSVLTALCVRDRQREMAKNAFANAFVCSDLDEFLTAGLDMVVEAAGQTAVAEGGERILASGRDLLTLSSGALADAELRARLCEAARRGSAQIKIPSGALAGFRGLMALRQSELDTVRYTSRKPSYAWKGTPADQAFDLDALSEPTLIFDGNAAEAALKFPANANLAAAVALAGIGFERTRVSLVADPQTRLNTGILEVKGPDGSMSLNVSGRAYAGNPKSSRLTGFSILAALKNEAAGICFV